VVAAPDPEPRECGRGARDIRRRYRRCDLNQSQNTNEKAGPRLPFSRFYVQSVHQFSLFTALSLFNAFNVFNAFIS
jgi:hypothetical protein